MFLQTSKRYRTGGFTAVFRTTRSSRHLILEGCPSPEPGQLILNHSMSLLNSQTDAALGHHWLPVQVLLHQFRVQRGDLQRQRAGKRSARTLGCLLRCGATERAGEPPQSASKTCSWSAATTAPARQITEKLPPQQGALGREVKCGRILFLCTTRHERRRGTTRYAEKFPQGVSISSRWRFQGRLEARTCFRSVPHRLPPPACWPPNTPGTGCPEILLRPRIQTFFT